MGIRQGESYNSKSMKGDERPGDSPRTTGGQGNGRGQNGRSTYTSYQKKSFDGEEDL